MVSIIVRIKLLGDHRSLLAVEFDMVGTTDIVFGYGGLEFSRSTNVF